MKYQVSKLTIYDLEILPNMFMFGAIHKGKVYQWVNNFEAVKAFLKQMTADGHILCGFNNIAYDDIVLDEYLRKKGDPLLAYQISKGIIECGLKRWQTDCEIKSVDLMKILPGRMSLKKLGVVLGHHKLQEMPIDFDKEATQGEIDQMCSYNVNDLEITSKLLTKLQPQLDLRAVMSEQYGIDLRSQGEAQIAELVLLRETGLKKRDLKRDIADFDFEVKTPSWWDKVDGEVKGFGDKVLGRNIKVRNHFITHTSDTVYLGDRYYTTGLGGLHSVDGAGCWKPGPGEAMGDWDITSMYPSIIITQGLEPTGWGGKFKEVYSSVVERRIKAKVTGDKVTADVLKIVANATYGKLGDKYSPLYDPEMMLTVTITGQLALLFLIEMITKAGHRVVSANTDGVTVIEKGGFKLSEVVARWEQITGLCMEYVQYQALYQSDINNYSALTIDGKLKTKGRLTDTPDLRKLPRALIVPRAVNQHLQNGIPIIETIQQETDLNAFILAGTVNYGWKTWCGTEVLGKVMRWYKSSTPDLPQIMKAPTSTTIKGNAGQVPYSENGVPVDNLPEGLPEDLDLNWYIDKAYTLLGEITRPKLKGMNAFAEELIEQGLQPNVVEKKKSLSRANVERGTVDFDSIPEGHHMVVRTGGGVMAEVVNGVTNFLYKVDKVYPSKTRATVEKDDGFTLVYGGSVPVHPWGIRWGEHESSFDDWYTPAELKKVRDE